MARTPKPAPEASLTERPNPHTEDLDQLALSEVIDRLLAEDAGVAAAVRRAQTSITAAAQLLTDTLEAGGRWLNVGAGTSGRLGVLDAAELPPTFGLDPERVQAVLAGAPTALDRAVEGAEDNAEEGASALRARNLCERDAVLAISASGRTPFALGAIEYAREAGARTLALCCDPDAELVRQVDLAIVAEVGPEAVAGSTRLKGGLAQKMILHTLSTATMVKLGRVRGNLMTEIQPLTEKLRARAVAIIARLASVGPEDARRALNEAGGSVPRALAALGVSDRGV